MKDVAKREIYFFIFSEWNLELPPPLRASAGPPMKGRRPRVGVRGFAVISELYCGFEVRGHSGRCIRPDKASPGRMRSSCSCMAASRSYIVAIFRTSPCRLSPAAVGCLVSATVDAASSPFQKISVHRRFLQIAGVNARGDRGSSTDRNAAFAGAAERRRSGRPAERRLRDAFARRRRRATAKRLARRPRPPRAARDLTTTRTANPRHDPNS